MPDAASDHREALHLHGSALAASLTVRDLDASLAWYRDLVGFTIDDRHEREGELVAVSLRAGDVRLLVVRDDGKKGWDRTKGEGISLQISTDQDVDELAARIVAHGGTLHSEPMTMSWGARVFRVRDPDGFVFSIANQQPG